MPYFWQLKKFREAKKKSERRDSNPRPRPWQGRALPAELLSLLLSDCKYTTSYKIKTFSNHFFSIVVGIVYSLSMDRLDNQSEIAAFDRVFLIKKV